MAIGTALGLCLLLGVSGYLSFGDLTEVRVYLGKLMILLKGLARLGTFYISFLYSHSASTPSSYLLRRSNFEVLFLK